MKLYNRASVSEFQTGAQAGIGTATAKIDIKADTNKVIITATASDAIAVRPMMDAVVATTSASTASVIATALVAVTVRPMMDAFVVTASVAVTASTATASVAVTASESITVRPMMDAVVATASVTGMASEAVTRPMMDTGVATTSAFTAPALATATANMDAGVAVASASTATALVTDTSSEAVTVHPAIKMDVDRAKGCSEWINSNPYVVPKKFFPILLLCQRSLSLLLLLCLRVHVKAAKISCLVLYTKLSVTFVTLYLRLTQSVPRCILRNPTPVTNYVELSSVTSFMTQKSLSVADANLVVGGSICTTIVSRQWTI
jgi:hypothetical protein